MKISLFVHDLAGNPIVRAAPLADALLELGHEVELLGLIIADRNVYTPYRDAYSFKVIRSGRSFLEVLFRAFRLTKIASGDVAFAFKPLITSFWPALLYSRFGLRIPLFLDVEDDDVVSLRPTSVRSFVRTLVLDWRKPNWYLGNAPLRIFVRRCLGVTVSSSRLQSYYGGRIVLHGPSSSEIPCGVGTDRQMQLRSELFLPFDRILLLFAGMASCSKGANLLVEALDNQSLRRHYHLVLAGDPTQPMFQDAKHRLGSDATVVGFVPFRSMFKLVQACDIVPVLQSSSTFAKSQIPGKMLEAFAQGRPVIGTTTGDLPRIILPSADSARGWIVHERTSSSLICLLKHIAESRGDSSSIARRGLAARAYYESHCSTEAIAAQLGQFPKLGKK